MARHRSPGTQHYDTHLELLARTSAELAGPRPASLDAIIVPASRPAANIDHAVTLARKLRCQLVVLCSLQARAAEVNEVLAARNFDQAVVVDLPSDYRLHILDDFATSRWAGLDLPEENISPNGDLSTKRNLGLLLARMLGWQRIFFMDDDIRDLDSADLYLTLSMLGPYHAAGMRAVDYPDNSVVCHGHRETGERQEVFISGSLLAVQCTEQLAFFPDIYNEDWFFFYHNAAERKLGWSGRDATQLCYDPFADPRRAAGQEFGDILAEGLYGLLHCGIDADQAVSDYWQLFLDTRMRFLEAILDRSVNVEPYLRNRINSSIETAMKWCAQITPQMCARYIRLWQQDLETWEQRLKEIRRKPSAAAALRQLSLAPSGKSPYALARVIGGSGGSRTEPVSPQAVAIPQSPTLELVHGIRLLAASQREGRAVDNAGASSLLQTLTLSAGANLRHARGAILRVRMNAAERTRRFFVAEDYFGDFVARPSQEGDRLIPGRHRKERWPVPDEPGESTIGAYPEPMAHSL